MKLLLTSVFGPYGVDDDYGKKENKMELFHNQITREQGLFSYRFHHNSFGLFFLAENVDTPTTVLDFPTFDAFIAEIKKGYDFIGISFIIPNFKRAQKMAELVRQWAPQTKIILGGHGVNTPNIDSLIEHDYICKGEGVESLRRILGEPLDQPITHPLLHSSYNRKIMGVPLPKTSGVLIPGVGCANRCRFCATAHFFDGYTAYLKNGEDIFNVCCRYQDELGITDFGVLDENFLKVQDRALELLALMEEKKRFFTFAIFSSAETLLALENLDVLTRLGVTLIWIGVESKQEVYLKNQDVDFAKLVRDLQKRGICVLASSILFLEHHDKNTIIDDMDFSISLKPDYLQFMQLGPIPGTTLYQDYQQKGFLLDNIPYAEQHGQDKIWFRHPHFSRQETQEFLQKAFARDYATNGASFVRAIRTTLRGYEYTLSHHHPLVVNRAPYFKQQLELMRYFLPAVSFFKENNATAKLLQQIQVEYRLLLGKSNLKARLFSIVVVFLAFVETLKIKFFADNKQPGELRSTNEQRFRQSPQLANIQTEDVVAV